MSRGDLTAAEWRILNPLLPDRGERGPAVPDKRRTADGILWVLRTGAPWRDMPERYGNWNSVFVRFTRWSKLGVWDAVFETLAFSRASHRRGTCHRFDDRAGALACSRRKRGNQNQEALGRSRGGFSTKIHLRSFITEQTRSKVPVFQSSDPRAMTPGVGKTLNVALRKALWDAGAVILIYTAPDQDWGYCMWECGVALLPESPDTRIILLQCGDTAPSLFHGQLGIDARKKTSVEAFVTQFMTDVDFLPHETDALTGYHKTAPEVKLAANKLFDDLQAVLPEGPVAEWPAHPYLQLQLPNASTRAIVDAPVENRQAVAREVVLSDTIVSDSDTYCHALFGMAEFDHVTLQDLYDTWRAAYPKSSDAWMDGLVDQLGRAAQWQFPTLKWTAMPTVGEGRPYAAVLTRVRKIPSLSGLQFDVYFYPFNLLDATPVQNRTVKGGDMLCRVLLPGGEGQVNVLDLLRELDDQRFSRLPFVDPHGRLVYIAHRSMLDQFISRQVRTGNVSNLAQLTLADMFAEQPEFKLMFYSTAAFVCAEGTLADAKLALNRRANLLRRVRHGNRYSAGAGARLADRRDHRRERAQLRKVSSIEVGVGKEAEKA